MGYAKGVRSPYVTSDSQVSDNWRQWNMTEGASGKESGSSKNRSYYKHVLCAENRPWKRILKAPDGRWIELVQTTKNIDWGEMEGCGTFYCSVPSIGVLSRWPDDEFTVEDMHKRNKYLMLMELIDHCENSLVGVSGASLSAGAPVYGSNIKQDVTQRCEEHYDRWDYYNKLFRLGWQSLPTSYRDDLLQDIRDRINNYNDPKSEAKRNRQKARREARKALGV